METFIKIITYLTETLFAMTESSKKTITYSIRKMPRAIYFIYPQTAVGGRLLLPPLPRPLSPPRQEPLLSPLGAAPPLSPLSPPLRPLYPPRRPPRPSPLQLSPRPPRGPPRPRACD